MRFELPYPLSVNHYYQKTQKGMVLSKAAKQYHKNAYWLLVNARRELGNKPLTDELAISIYLYPPDLRKRDNDNTQKCTYDTLQKNGIVADDYQFKELFVKMMPKVKGGKMVIEIKRLATVRNPLIV